MTLVLAPALAGCGGGGDGDERTAEQAVDGTFVGKVTGTNAFVAVVASPRVGKQEKRDVAVYVADGKRLSEWFPASVVGNSFTAASDDSDAEVQAKLSGKAVTGTLKLPGGKTVEYQASPATGAAGLYDLKVSRKGRLSGASAAGVGLKGETLLDERTGTLKLADGRRRKLALTGVAGDDVTGLRAGQVRLIVLDDGLTGAGMPRSEKRDAAFLVRSAG